MTLKNSFLANLKENNKRRIWLWLVSILGFVIMYPSLIAMSLSRTAASLEYYLGGNMDIDQAREYIHELMLNDMKYLLGINEFAYFVIGVFAIISAIQGFSYLYSRQKIDFYMGMPVKRKTRFFIIWLNGILVYLIPYLLELIISGTIAAANGAINGDVLREMALAYGMHLCYFLGMYHLGILAVMLTGNVVITICGVLVFLFYELIARIVMRGYMELFFRFFSDYNYSVTPALSPFAILDRYENGRELGNVSLFLTVVLLLLFALVVGAIAYFLYLKRPGEAAGRAMVFSWSCPWIRLMISVLVSMLAGIAVCDIVEYRPKYYGDRHIGFVIFTMVLALLISGCLMQVIYEFDIRGILHRKRQLLISAAVTVLLFCVFRFDLLGYDTYLPDAEQIESAALVTGGAYGYYGSEYFDEDMRGLARINYVQENMYLADTGAVNKLMKLCIDASREKGGMNAMFMDESREWHNVEVTFRLKNNREVHRSIYVDVNDPETVELLDRIESSEEYLSGSYMAFSPVMDQVLADDRNNVSVTYDNGAYKKQLSRKEMTELLTLYRQDMRTTDFSSLSASVPVGSVLLNITRENGRVRRGRSTCYMQLNIYPFFNECMQYLREKGCYMDGYFNPEDVERIQVTNYHYDLQRETDGIVRSAIDAFAESAMDADSTSSYVTYEGDSILQLADNLYPSQLTNAYWYTKRREDRNYSITVFFKPESIAAGGENVVRYVFLEGEVPDFVVRDTAYVE